MKARLVVGALPLLVYPFVARASFMSLAGETQGNEPLPLMIAARLFQVTSLVYPLVYVGSLIVAVSARKQNVALARRAASVPLWFLALIVASFAGWVALSRGIKIASHAPTNLPRPRCLTTCLRSCPEF